MKRNYFSTHPKTPKSCRRNDDDLWENWRQTGPTTRRKCILSSWLLRSEMVGQRIISVSWKNRSGTNRRNTFRLREVPRDLLSNSLKLHHRKTICMRWSSCWMRQPWGVGCCGLHTRFVAKICTFVYWKSPEEWKWRKRWSCGERVEWNEEEWIYLWIFEGFYVHEATLISHKHTFNIPNPNSVW